MRVSPNHFFEEPALSITSTRPGRSGSIDGTWFARIPMSPVAADRLTCTTSVEVKIAYHASELRTAQQVQWRWEDAPGAGEREKVLFCQLLRHSHDEPRQKDPGHVVQRKRRDGAQTSHRRFGYTRGAKGASEAAVGIRDPENTLLRCSNHSFTAHRLRHPCNKRSCPCSPEKLFCDQPCVQPHLSSVQSGLVPRDARSSL